MRQILGHPRKKALTQGMIFSAGAVSGYTGKEVYGLIITARCDIAQSKVESYHYVPVVSLKDWMEINGVSEISERAIENAKSSIRTLLKNNDFSPSAIESQDPRFVMDRLFPDGSDDRSTRKAREKFLSYIEDIEKASSLSSLERASSLFPGVAAGLATEVIKNKITGLYFIEKIDPLGEDRGYVIMLRNISRIPQSLGRAIECGLDASDYKEYINTDITASGCLDFSAFDYCMPVSQISSPYVEHIMQAFSAVFSRIGVDDLSKSYIDTLWVRQNVGGVK